MTIGRRSRTLLAAAVLTASVAVVPTGSASHVAAAPPVLSCAVGDTMCAGGEFHPIPQPLRILDTRPAAQSGTGPINDPGGRRPLGVASVGTAQFDVDLLGLSNGLPNPNFRNFWLGGTQVDSPSDVLAVVATVTVVDPTSSGFLKAYAAGETEPNAALLTFEPGKNMSNLGILRPNASGQLTIALRGGATGGSADVVIDVFGWFSTSTYNVDTAAAPTTAHGARFETLDPFRIQDTRNTGIIGPHGSLHVPVRGVGGATGIPSGSNIVGVVLNVTGVTPSAGTFLSVVPSDPGGVAPSTANVTLAPGEIKANLVIAPVNPATGDVWIYNHAGNTDIVVDVMGYLDTGVDPTLHPREGRVVPLTTPFRAFDTRDPLFGSAPLGPRQAEDWSFAAFAASVNIGGVAVGNQAGLIGTLTNAALTRANPRAPVSSYLTVYPSPGVASTPPLIADLNSVDTSPLGGGAPVPNMAVVRYNPANSTVRIYNHDGYADYLIDVSAVVLAD
jgi:hypothetical protein